MRAGRVRCAISIVAFAVVPSLLASTSLPPLPELRTDNLFPSVLQQIEDAYQSARAHPMDAAANGKLGMVLDAYEQYAPAVVCYLRAHRLDPRSFDWAYDLGYVLFKQGQYAEAANALQDALRLRPRYLPAQLKLAESLFQAGQVEAAGKLYQAIIQQAPNSAEAYYGLGRVQAAQNNTSAAVVSLEKACQLVPEYGAAQFALATAYRKLGQAQKAAEHFKLYQANMATIPPADDPVRAAVQQLNQSALAHIRKGLALADAGDLQGAIREHLEAIQADHTDVQAYINLIQLYARTGQDDKAEESYREAVKLDPNRADCYYNYGYLLAVQGHFDEALAEYHKAIENRPDFRLAHFHIGQIYANEGKYAEAIQEFRKILTPDDASTPSYLYALGATYARAGDRQNALLYMRKARDEAQARNQAQLLASINQDLANLEQ